MQIQYELLRTTSQPNFTSKEDDRRQHFEKCYAGPEIVTHRSQSNTIRRMLRNTRQSWILDPIPWIVDSGCWIPVFFSGTWILDSMPQWDFGVLQLYSGFQSPGFRLPRAKFFPDFAFYKQRISQILESGYPQMGRSTSQTLSDMFTHINLIKQWEIYFSSNVRF